MVKLINQTHVEECPDHSGIPHFGGPSSVPLPSWTRSPCAPQPSSEQLVSHSFLFLSEARNYLISYSIAAEDYLIVGCWFHRNSSQHFFHARGHNICLSVDQKLLVRKAPWNQSIKPIVMVEVGKIPHWEAGRSSRESQDRVSCWSLGWLSCRLVARLASTGLRTHLTTRMTRPER